MRSRCRLCVQQLMRRAPNMKSMFWFICHRLLIDLNPYVSPYQVNVPNYITSKTIEAPIVMVDGIADPDLFDGKVAVIEGRPRLRLAVFNKYCRAYHEIWWCKFTPYGHSVWRVSSLPAAIGCGAQIFSDLQSSTMVRLNCSEKTVTTS